MTKHVAKNATVDATEVTESNIEKLAEKHDAATLHTSQRTDGLRFLLVEGPKGSTRADVGGYVVEHADGTLTAFQTAEAFDAVYERP